MNREPINSSTYEELLKLDNDIKTNIIKYQSEFITKRVPSKRDEEVRQYVHAKAYIKGLKYASNLIAKILKRDVID